MRRLLAALFLFVPLSLFADDPHSGHQHPHDAPDLGNIGTVRLQTSCSEQAQAEVNRGTALMHSFWYPPAEQTYRNAAKIDPQCGMAWWGVAMANLHPIWAPPTPSELKTGAEAAAKATATGAKTDRERAYIAAIAAFYADADKLDHKTRMAAYEQAMAALERDNPKDREAAIFHALALLGVASPTDKTYVKQKEAAAILNRVLPEEPEHPGIAHYLIHSFDYPDLAELALPAARVYAKLAPGSPHALHMPSHIFTRLGLWDEAIASNLASAEKARNYVAKTMPGATAYDELHAIDYLVYAYLQQGRVDDARKLVEKVAKVTRVNDPNQFAAAHAISAVPARFALERRQWKEAAALAVPTVIDWTKVPYAEANIHFARGIGGARSGDLATTRDAAARLAAIRQALIDQKNNDWATRVEVQRLSVAAWLAHAEKNDDEALRLMRAAADLDATVDKHPVTPGAIIPARELLAELLLDLGHPADALTEAQKVLKDAPKRKSAETLMAKAKVE